ncbi:MAG TPA: 4-alpha-glucanotransferase, partial [Candidatus Dormibacteraeota bacterium]|nr:4-alpha-glucanotransferase [Candidatus Dormibacteraeota bacterium]
SPNTVAYTGTHDNNTTRGWFESLPENVSRAVRSYAAQVGAASGDVAWDFLRLVWSSKAGLAIAPLQDLSNLGVEGRMNVPGVAKGNWGWRCTEEMLKPPIFERLRELTTNAGRMAEPKAELQQQEALQ